MAAASMRHHTSLLNTSLSSRCSMLQYDGIRILSVQHSLAPSPICLYIRRHFDKHVMHVKKPHRTRGRMKGGESINSAPSEYMKRQLTDPYVKLAHSSHYRSRSAFKLIEIADKYKLFRKGMRVVDVGAAPGGWTQVAVERIFGEDMRLLDAEGEVRFDYEGADIDNELKVPCIIPIEGLPHLAPSARLEMARYDNNRSARKAHNNDSETNIEELDSVDSRNGLESKVNNDEFTQDITTSNNDQDNDSMSNEFPNDKVVMVSMPRLLRELHKHHTAGAPIKVKLLSNALVDEVNAYAKYIEAKAADDLENRRIRLFSMLEHLNRPPPNEKPTKASKRAARIEISDNEDEHPKNTLEPMVVSIDLLPMKPIAGAVILGETDFTDPDSEMAVLKALRWKRAHLVMSDMAPNSGGIASIDHIKLSEMLKSVVLFSCRHLTTNGTLLFKLRAGVDTPKIVATLEHCFQKVHKVKPPASRRESSEIYLICLKFNSKLSMAVQEQLEKKDTWGVPDTIVGPPKSKVKHNPQLERRQKAKLIEPIEEETFDISNYNELIKNGRLK